MTDERQEIEKRHDMLEFTYICSPFYQNKRQKRELEIAQLLEDWELAEIIDKSELAQAGKKLVAYSYYPRLVRGEIVPRTVSDNVGKCLTIYRYKKEMDEIHSIMQNYREKWVGIRSVSPFCYFFTARDEEERQKGYRCIENGMGFVKSDLNRAKLAEICEKMVCYQPEWIMAPTSIALLLADYIREHQKKISALKYVELSGKTYSRKQKEELEQVFGCPVRYVYRGDAIGNIAYECSCGKLHLIEEAAYTEICRNGHATLDGIEGDVVVTSLCHHVMPFVRCNTGEQGRIKQESCQCGETGRILELSFREEADMIQCPKGDFLHPSIFGKIFSNISDKYELQIRQFQVVQSECELFDIYIASDSRQERIISAFRREVENTPIEDAFFQFHFQSEKYIENRLRMKKYFRCDIS